MTDEEKSALIGAATLGLRVTVSTISDYIQQVQGCSEVEANSYAVTFLVENIKELVELFTEKGDSNERM